MEQIKETDMPSDCYPKDMEGVNPIEFYDDGDPMHVKQYGALTARKIKCKQCGSKQFTVAQEDYLTAIRCETCKYELVIHEG